MSAPLEVKAIGDVWDEWVKQPSFPFDKKHCINGTRVVTTVLGKLGVKAKPVSVQVLLFNRPALELFKAGVPTSEWPAHAWSIGIGPGASSEQEPGMWDGHLMTEGDDWTLDVTWRSFNRPGRVRAEGAVIFPRIPDQKPLVMEDPFHQTISLGRWPENNAWRQAAGWKRPQPAEVDEVLRRTEKRLGELQWEYYSKPENQRMGEGPVVRMKDILPGRRTRTDE